MSINDPIELRYHPKRDRWYIAQGRETFYDENDHLIEFESAEDAAFWAVSNMSLIPLSRTHIKGVRKNADFRNDG